MIGTVRYAGITAGAGILLLSATAWHAAARADQDVAPTADTLRVDYYHTGRGGDAALEVFSLDEVVREPLPWPGNPDRFVDTAARGKYLFEVRDPADDALLYSRSFSSIYGEWETTAEASLQARTFHESLRLPDPGRAVRHRPAAARPGESFPPIWRTASTPATTKCRQPAAASPIDVIAIDRQRRPGRQGRSAAAGRRLHGGGTDAVSRARARADARRCSRSAVSRAPRRLQRLGAGAAGEQSGRVPTVDRRPSRFAARRALRRVRQRTLHADLREPAVARYRSIGAV